MRNFVIHFCEDREGKLRPQLTTEDGTTYVSTTVDELGARDAVEAGVFACVLAVCQDRETFLAVTRAIGISAGGTILPREVVL